MKVMQLHTSYREPGGEDAAVLTDRALLKEAGVHVDLVQVDNPAGKAAAVAALATSSWNRHAADRVRQAANRLQPDVVHVHNTWFALSPAVLPALSELGLPIVMTLHNYRLRCAAGTLFREGKECELCLQGSALPGLRHRCYRDSTIASAFAVGSITFHWRRQTYLDTVDRFLIPSDTARSRFLRAGLPAARLRVRPNPVLDMGERDTPPSTSDTVLYVGRLSPEKGLSTVLDAFAAAEMKGTQLVVIGDGPQREELERRSPAGVQFLGRQAPQEVARQLRRARALVFPSTWVETFGLVPVEAMAAGLPLLVSDIGDVPSFPDVDGGFVLPPGDVRAWTQALEAVVGPFDVNRAGRANRQRYETHFSTTASMAALQRTYDEVISERAAREGGLPI